MEISLAGKRVLITGASRGIGRAIAQTVHACGGHVIALSRTRADLDALASELAGISTIVCDLADWDAARKMAHELGDVDCLVNNAGTYFPPDNIMCASQEQINKTFDLNVKAVINLSQVIGGRMKTRGQGGSIVNISSIASKMPLSKLHVYCSSKSALDMVTRSLAVELGPCGVRVNSVNPTIVWTDLARDIWTNPDENDGLLNATPLRRFATVQDVANAVVFLLSDRASVLTGVILPVDGGITAGR